jgi:uncharacterized membrane protein YtjA (UPF0391 family)
MFGSPSRRGFCRDDNAGDGRRFLARSRKISCGCGIGGELQSRWRVRPATGQSPDAGLYRFVHAKGALMLYWATVFLVIALIAGVVGIDGIATASAGVAQVLFFIFLVLFVIALIARAIRSQT